MAMLVPGQAVAGDIPLSVTLDSLAGRLGRVVFRVDDQDVATLLEAPFAYTLRTRTFPPGEHTVSVRVYLRTPRGWLLSAVGAPHVLLGAPLVFDQSVPAAVAVTSATLEAGRPRVTWAPSRASNFYAYVVYRRPTESESPGPGQAVAVIRDRTQTTFLDEPLPNFYGSGYAYSIAVSNRDQERVSAASQDVTFGVPETARIAETGQAAESRDGQRLYTLTDGRLVESSAATRRPVRTLDLPGLSYPTTLNGDVHVDPATGRIVVTARSYRIWTVDPGSFTVVSEADLLFGGSRFALGGGRLFTTSDRLAAFDPATGAVVAQTAETIGLQAETIGATPDGRAVYVIDPASASQTTLVRYDASGAALVAAQRVPLGFPTFQWAGTVGPDGRVFAFVRQTLFVFDGTTLQPRGTLALAEGRGARAVRVRGDRIYLLYTGTDAPIPGGGEIAEVDAASLRVLRTWRFRRVPLGIAFGGPGELLAFNRSDTRSIPL